MNINIRRQTENSAKNQTRQFYQIKDRLHILNKIMVLSTKYHYSYKCCTDKYRDGYSLIFMNLFPIIFLNKEAKKVHIVLKYKINIFKSEAKLTGGEQAEVQIEGSTEICILYNRCFKFAVTNRNWDCYSIYRHAPSDPAITAVFLKESCGILELRHSQILHFFFYFFLLIYHGKYYF